MLASSTEALCTATSGARAGCADATLGEMSSAANAKTWSGTAVGVRATCRVRMCVRSVL